MGFKNIRYNTGECLVKIRIENETGALLENWTIMFSDLAKWFNTMRRKYGIKGTKDTDLDWAR